MTGDPTPYTPTDLEILVEKLGDIPDDATAFDVFGDIEWSGEYNPTARRVLRAGIGTYGMDLDRVRAAKAHADAARSELGRARANLTDPPRLKTYTATGWHAQLSKLTGHANGSRSADAAGLNPSPRTLTRWLAGEQTPSPANRAAIRAAYDDMATRQGREAAQAAFPGAQSASARANQALANALNAALLDSEGAQIRIFRPDRFNWS